MSLESPQAFSASEEDDENLSLVHKFNLLSTQILILQIFQRDGFHKSCRDFRKKKKYWVGQKVRSGFWYDVKKNPNKLFGQPNNIAIENLLQNRKVDLPLKFNYLIVLLFR